jgi:hypothetical protein
MPAIISNLNLVKFLTKCSSTVRMSVGKAIPSSTRTNILQQSIITRFLPSQYIIQEYTHITVTFKVLKMSTYSG